MKPWPPLVVAPDMVKTGDIVKRFAWQPKPRSSVPTCHSGVGTDRYVRELTDHIRSWRRRRILLPL
jgi:hypothetical protein